MLANFDGTGYSGLWKRLLAAIGKRFGDIIKGGDSFVAVYRFIRYSGGSLYGRNLERTLSCNRKRMFVESLVRIIVGEAGDKISAETIRSAMIAATGKGDEG